MFPVLSTSIYNLQLLIRYVSVRIVNSFTLKNYLVEKKMQLIASLVDVTLQADNLQIPAWIRSENRQTNVQVYKDSFCLILLEEGQVQVLHLTSCRDFLLIMERKPKLVSVSTLLLPYPHLVWSLITQSWLHITCKILRMSILCQTIRHFMIFAGEIWISKDQHIPI